MAVQPTVDIFPRLIDSFFVQLLIYLKHRESFPQAINTTGKEDIMILADKIITLRKQFGLSQEQLAEKLGVSRQSVSKWELGVSIPDLDKIIKLSEIFGVSADYLIKDNLTEIPKTATAQTCHSYDEEEHRLVTLDDANSYMDLCRRLSSIMAFGIALCIVSPTPLILLGGISELPQYLPRQELMGAVGVALLLVIVAAGVAVIIVCGMQLGKWDFLEKADITLEYGVRGIVEKKKDAFEKRYILSTATGVALCIVGVVPLLIAAGFDLEDYVYTILVDVLLLCIAAAVFLFVKTGLVNGSYQKLLQQGEYSVNEKRANRRLEPVSTIYWCVVTAIYLFWSFYTFNWHRTWIIWPVAGVLYAVVEAIARSVGRNRDN